MVVEPPLDIAGDVQLLLAAQHDVDTLNLGNLLTLKLGIAPSHYHQRVGIELDQPAYVLAALAVGQLGHAAGVHHTNVGLLVGCGHNNSALAQQFAQRRRLREIELAAQCLKAHPM